MADFLIVVGFFGFIAYLVLCFVSLFKRNGLAKKRIIKSGVLFAVMILGLVFTDDTEVEDATATVEEVEDTTEVEVEEQVEEKPEEIKKEQISFTYEKAAYSAETETFDIIVNTNLPNETEVYFGLVNPEDENDYNGVPDSGIVQDGVINVTLGDYVDDYEGREYMSNGSYELAASFSINKETESNSHLIDQYGEYNEFVDGYEISGNISETDNGYMVEKISATNVEITEAYSEEEIQNFSLQKLKETATELSFAQLDKNPDRHAGEYVTYTGEIIEITENEDRTILRLALDDYNSEVLFVEYEGWTDFVNGDRVTIYGTVYGAFSYTSQAGWEITIPGIIADIIE